MHLQTGLSYVLRTKKAGKTSLSIDKRGGFDQQRTGSQGCGLEDRVIRSRMPGVRVFELCILHGLVVDEVAAADYRAESP
jgi:hypothetical protein